MADKISTIVLKVDLNCRSCYKKISKTIRKLQAREKIQTVAFDEKNDTVTISGPFDPEKLCKKLCCKACKVIKDIQIKENKEKEKPKDTKPAEPAKPKTKETKPAEPVIKPKETKPTEQAKPKEEKPKATKPAEPSKPKEDKPKSLEPEKPKPKPKPKFEPVQPKSGCHPIWPGPTCNCGCSPWFEGHYGACPWCGRGYGWTPVVVPQPVVVCGGPPAACGGYKTCEFFYEEDPQSSCSIM